MNKYVTELPLEEETPSWIHNVDEIYDEWNYYPFEFDWEDWWQSSYATIRMENDAVSEILYCDKDFKPHEYPPEQAKKLSLEEAKVLCEMLVRLDGGPVHSGPL